MGKCVGSGEERAKEGDGDKQAPAGAQAILAEEDAVGGRGQNGRWLRAKGGVWGEVVQGVPRC